MELSSEYAVGHIFSRLLLQHAHASQPKGVLYLCSRDVKL